MTLTGVRGYIVVSCLGFGLALLYAAVCLVMPAFGAVSSYGSVTRPNSTHTTKGTAQ